MQISTAKLFIERAIFVHHDALHVLAGVLLALVAAALLRRSLTSWCPWLVVLGFELANEVYDYFSERWPSEVPQQLGEIAKDVGLTMALPTLLMVIARCWPRLLVGKKMLADEEPDV